MSDDECIDRSLGVGIHQRRAARELRRSPMNEPGPCVTMLGISQPAVLHDIDLTGEDDKGAGRDFAGRDDAFARRIGFELAEPPQPTDLRRSSTGTSDRVGLR